MLHIHKITCKSIRCCIHLNRSYIYQVDIAVRQKTICVYVYFEISDVGIRISYFLIKSSVMLLLKYTCNYNYLYIYI